MGRGVRIVDVGMASHKVQKTSLFHDDNVMVGRGQKKERDGVVREVAR